VIFGIAVVFSRRHHLRRCWRIGQASRPAGCAGVFPVVITFGVDSPGIVPVKANSYRRCAPVNNGGNVASD